ncbi:MAG: dihydrolipoyl dehydrogenase [Proteobacteria bacterium]|nr:dihydrolipoyl dehydrogenase [Pseudomonadota bacterium]
MSEDNQFDLIVIGAGPGGYVAAVKAAQLGMKVACVDKNDRLGGVCLNSGCIPSKALLDSSEYYALAKESLSAHGISCKEIDLNLSTLMNRKNEIIQQLTGNVRSLLERHKVTIIRGMASMLNPKDVEVTLLKEDGHASSEKKILTAKNILLATGSKPLEINSMPFDGKTIVSAKDALSFDKIPDHLVVVGGGYIGLELGSVWCRLGSKVTVLEMLPSIAGVMDGQISRTLLRLLKKQGIGIELKTKVLKAEAEKETVLVTISKDGMEKETIRCDKLLVAVGRKPLTDGLNLDRAGLQLNASGGLDVDPFYRTAVKHIYAIGDLIPGPMLAHKASAEGRAAVENMAGLSGEVNYDAIPSIIYTFPEAASVGLTEEQVKERNIPCRKGTFPFSGTGRARCLGETEGLVKVLAHEKTGRLIGVHIIGARAADMIAEAVLAIEVGASAEDIGRVIHGHPTFSEAFQEAAMAVQG